MRLDSIRALCALPILILAGCQLEAGDKPAGKGPQPRLAEVTARLEEALDKEKQKRTIADLRNVGTAMYSWLTDQLAAGAAGQTEVIALADYPQISREKLAAILVPQYISSLPETDGWGHPLEFRLDVANVRSRQVMLLRSPGRDGVYSADAESYTVGSFPAGQYDEDIVWADGFFVRWPERTPGAREGAP